MVQLIQFKAEPISETRRGRAKNCNTKLIARQKCFSPTLRRNGGYCFANNRLSVGLSVSVARPNGFRSLLWLHKAFIYYVLRLVLDITPIGLVQGHKGYFCKKIVSSNYLFYHGSIIVHMLIGLCDDMTPIHFVVNK